MVACLVVLVPLALAPAFARPQLGLLVALAPVLVFLAARSVAYPVALLGIPTLVIAFTNSDPFPNGSVSAARFAWIALAILLAVAARRVRLPVDAFLSLPVLSSVLLGLFMLMRLAGSPASDYGSLKTKLFFLLNLTLLLAGVVIGQRRKSLNIYLVLALVVAGMSAAVLLYRLIRGDAQMLFDSRFSISSEVNPIQLGREAADGLIIGVYVLLAARSTTLRFAALALLPALGVALVGAGSRGPMLGLLVGLVVLLALTLQERAARVRLISLAGVGVLIALLTAELLPGGSISRSLDFLTGSGSGLSSNGRSTLWQEASTVISNHPLAGIGTGGFQAVDTLNVYPHNLFLEIGSELGFVGLALLLAFFATTAATFVRAWRSSVGDDRFRTAVVAALFAAAFVNAMFSGDIQTNAGVWFTAGLGVGLTMRWGSRQTSEPEVPEPQHRTRAGLLSGLD